MWTKCRMHHCKPCSHVQLSRRFQRKRVRDLPQRNKYDNGPVLKFIFLCSPCLLVTQPSNPCNPSPCGPNSQCRVINEQAVCSCLQGFIGNPPTCRPECVTSSECPLNLACIAQKCADPCPGSCGINALCQVVNHNPICSCASQFTGDPFVRCINIRKY